MRVIGGYGHEMPTDTRLTIAFLTEKVVLTVEPGESAWFDYDTFKALEVSGAGAKTSGGGFIGGGFGLGGAIAGMLAASVMNAATTKTEIETDVSLTATAWAVIVVYGTRSSPTRCESVSPLLSVGSQTNPRGS